MDVDEAKARPLPTSYPLEPPNRVAVFEQYQELLTTQKGNRDNIFIGGYTLRELDPHLVVLDEEPGTEHPRMWTSRKKIWATAYMAAFAFFSPFASTIFAPSLYVVMNGLRITDATIGALQISISMFAYAIGPLFLAPLSEIYGRVVILHIGNITFVAFSIGAGFCQTAAQFSICRFFSGLGGSAGIAVLGGFIADLWSLEQRPKASGIATLGPVLGPILGPVCGGWMSERASWRWALWVPAIASGVLLVAGLILLPETYAPRVLQMKLQKQRKSRSDEQLYTVLDFTPRPTSVKSLATQIFRPVVYLILDPALLLASWFFSVVFGVIYLVIVTYADVFALGYHHSVGIVGTDFLAVGIGMIIGSIATVKAMDALFKRDEAGKATYRPESRLISCIVGTALVVGGLFMYGFSALRAHFIVPLIGMFIFAMGSTNIFLALQLYTIDGFRFPASAFSTILRSIFAGAFPLFGPKLFGKLGIDWGVALLAFLVLGIGLPCIALLYVFGARLRKVGVKRVENFEGI
ncbi:major facilitator superfamily domain-containing protein [Lophiotrema nucula]|uniref:Major facilitator superfamily domain-containing protein n=1 Tax=Lophiotrema nucula TaxID=690887 RepID=A0A6A5Z526_9PLEO|nr:major facilitator superfamily domain-containing protein [Lophiotrema nucula]